MKRDEKYRVSTGPEEFWDTPFLTHMMSDPKIILAT